MRYESDNRSASVRDEGECMVEADGRRGERGQVVSVAAAIFAAFALFFIWRFVKARLWYWGLSWGWDAIDFALPLPEETFMDLALVSFVVCMLAAMGPHVRRLMGRPDAEWGDTREILYWLGSGACAWCLMSATVNSVPMEFSVRMSFEPGDGTAVLQIAYIVLSVAVYAAVTVFAHGERGMVKACCLCFAPAIALFSGAAFVAIGIAFVAVHLLRRIGDALNEADAEADEWTDEDDEMFDELYGKWRRVCYRAYPEDDGEARGEEDRGEYAAESENGAPDGDSGKSDADKRDDGADGREPEERPSDK